MLLNFPPPKPLKKVSSYGFHKLNEVLKMKKIVDEEKGSSEVKSDEEDEDFEDEEDEDSIEEDTDF